MTHRWKRIAKLSALGACCSVAVWISSTNAKDGETSVLVKKQDATKAQVPADEGPILPPPAKQPTQNGDLFAPQQPAAPTLTKPIPPTTPSTQPRENSTVKRPFMQPATTRTSPWSADTPKRTNASAPGATDIGTACPRIKRSPRATH